MKWFLVFMIGTIVFWVVLFIFAMSRPAKAEVLTCTIPDRGQLRYVDPTFGPDSTMVLCSGGDTTSVDSLKFYRWESGGYRFYQAFYVRGMEGQLFTSPPFPPGNYYANAKNQWGESCGGNVVTIPGPTTGVPIGETGTPGKLPVLGRLYDVRGRLVQGRPAAGIYFTEKKRKVVVNSRGEIISR